MKKVSVVLTTATLLGLAGCGASPTSAGAAPAEWQANTAESDGTAERVPNMFGSGN